MFEKEANEYAKEVTKKYVFMEHGRASALGFQKGAEFGYNKCKEEANDIINELLINGYDESTREKALNFLYPDNKEEK